MTAAQKSELRVAVRSNFVAPSPAAGNGIFGCRDRAPKSRLKCANVGRDQNPRSEWPEIPAETPYWESYRKRAVCDEVKYKNEILRGEQPPIMDRTLFQAVRQKSLAQWSHRTIVRNKS